jgi:small conductance mechanosensitive channel
MPVQNLLIDLVVRYGFQVVGALVFLAVGLLAARWVGALAERQLERHRMEPPLRQLIVRAIRIVVLLLALVIALDKFGFQIAPLVAGIGVAGLGIGIAMQGVLSNVVAGLTIIFTKPFRVGEHIAVAGVAGEVSEIQLFSTTLLHPDRSRVIIPNRKIVGEILHNYGTTRQLAVNVAVPHDVDVAVLLGAARDLVRANPRVLKDPAPAVGISQVSDAGVRLSIGPWVKVGDMAAAEAELYEAVVQSFRALGIRRPALQRHEIAMLDGRTASV